MAETSAIEWTDATVNFWWGCTKVSPACDNCYAEDWNALRGNGEWGPNAPRRVIEGARASLQRLNRKAPGFIAMHGRHPRVFMHSMSDLFDNEVSDTLRHEALNEAEKAALCHIQIVTKRIANVEKMVPSHWLEGCWPKHVGLMVSVCQQREAKRDFPRLIALKKRFSLPWIGTSMEPLIEPVDIDDWAADLDWVIVGGESGRNARPMHPTWAGQIMRTCRRRGAAFFFKNGVNGFPNTKPRRTSTPRCAARRWKEDRCPPIRTISPPSASTTAPSSALARSAPARCWKASCAAPFPRNCWHEAFP